jgi:pimeloyl-ACP methyl ester carboxylesterase
MNPALRALLIVVGVAALALPVAAEDKFFTANGISIRYIDQGRGGEVVVLVHGFTSNIERGFVERGVVADLSKDYRVLALDLRGHGKSGKPHDPAAYGKEMCVDVIRLLDHVGVSRAHIVGYSQGARVVGYLLTTYPQRFKTATLGGSPPRVGWPPEEADRAEQDAQRMEQANKSGVSDGQDYVALAAVARARSTQVVTEAQLRAVVVPMIGIVGSKDPRLESMQALKQIMPALLQVTVVEGATHTEVPSRPEFIRTVREFLESQKARALAPPR